MSIPPQNQFSNICKHLSCHITCNKTLHKNRLYSCKHTHSEAKPMKRSSHQVTLHDLRHYTRMGIVVASAGALKPNPWKCYSNITVSHDLNIWMPTGSRGRSGYQSSRHFKRLGRRRIKRRTRNRAGTSKHWDTETLCFGVLCHVTCMTHCKKWYSMTHTVARTQHAHSTSHPVHCNIVPCQATPFINPTCTNSIWNSKLKSTAMACYVTGHSVTLHSQQIQQVSDTAHTNTLTQGDGGGRVDGVGWGEKDK